MTRPHTHTANWRGWRLWLLALALVLACGRLYAQTYLNEPTTYAWIDPSGHTAATWSGASRCSSSGPGTAWDDDITDSIPLGFNFRFGSSNYSSLFIMTNGRIQFGNRYCYFGALSDVPRTYPLPYPDANLTRTMKVYGADLDFTYAGRVTYRSLGTSPNRYFVITWISVPEWNAPGSSFNFQVILFESGDFVYQYASNTNTSGGKAQIGWEISTSDYDLLSFTNIGSLTGRAYRFYNRSAAIIPGGFNAYESATAAGAISGVIQTKVAGQAFALDLVALNATRTGVLSTFAGSVTLEILNASDNSGALNTVTGCRSSWTVAQTVTGSRAFAATNLGRITVTGLLEANAWREARIRITHTPASGAAVVACSSDNFAIRPASFSTPVATDADWRTSGSTRSLTNTAVSGGVVHAAGRPFRVSVNALNAAGVVTTGYTGVPSLVFGGCALPATCAGASAASLIASFSTAAGVSVAPAATYAEAGSFSATASDPDFANVDAADGTPAAQRLIQSGNATIGRFVPDRYLLSLSNTPVLEPGQGVACTGRADWNFTWIGQAFRWATAPTITVTAQDASGATVRQYAGSLFKLTTGMVSLAWSSNAPGTAPLTVTGQTLTLVDAGNGQSTATLGTAAVLRFTRPSTPVTPFNAVIALTVDVADGSEAAVSGNGTIGDVASLVIDGSGAGIAFTGTNAAGANLQTYGRLQLLSAHGDSRRALALPYETQGWSGSAWYRQHRDSCTSPVVATLALQGWSAGLSACDVSVAAVARATRGLGTVQLSAPTAARTGSVELRWQLGTAAGSSCVAGAATPAVSAGLDWLLGPWSSAPAYTSAPAARASFGLFRSESLLRRELY